jgi:hypothetical protein
MAKPSCEKVDEKFSRILQITLQSYLSKKLFSRVMCAKNGSVPVKKAVNWLKKSETGQICVSKTLTPLHR